MDLGESTFGVLKNFLEKNNVGIQQEQLTCVFSDTRYCGVTYLHYSVLLLLLEKFIYSAVQLSSCCDDVTEECLCKACKCKRNFILTQ